MRSVLVVVLAFLVGVANAADLRRMTLSNGVIIEYALALPDGYRGEATYPAILAFPGGRQTLASVDAALSRYWEREAVQRGYIVVSPAAPPGLPFYEAGAELIPEFLERQLALLGIEGGKFHVAGASNGAVSAFIAATRYPQLFHTVTALAGFPEREEDFARLDRLDMIKIVMFVGMSDDYWRAGMEKTRDRLRVLGQSVCYEALPRNGHLLPDLSFEKSGRIFQRMTQLRC